MRLQSPAVRVAVDATPLLGSRTGVATFTLGLLRALPATGVETWAYALSLRAGRAALGEKLPAGVGLVDLRAPMPAGALTRAWLHSDLPAAETFVGNVDVIHGTNYVVPPARRAAQVVSVYDLTSVRFPELCAPASLRYPALVRRAVSRGAWVHVLAAAIGDEVVDLLGVDRDRVRVVTSGLDVGATGDASRGRRLAGAPRYVLGLGTVEPRKRFPDLVRAFEQVAAASDDLGLVIAGPDGWDAAPLAAAIDRSPHRRRIRRVGWVDDRDRADLLAGAAVLALPSVYEGFGYPPLEAMAAGTPVVATSVGAMPEVLADGAALVEPMNVDALGAAIARVLDDEHYREALVTRGRARAATFSWSDCAVAMAALYADATTG